MAEFIQFFQSADVTLSDKLLEVVYILIGVVAIYAGLRNLTDKTNEKRVGSAVFWCVLGLLFVVGRWIPSTWVGVLVVVMVIPAIFRQVGRGTGGE
ncbi:DUF979 family protein, partial [Bacteroides mediterraneensis]